MPGLAGEDQDTMGVTKLNIVPCYKHLGTYLNGCSNNSRNIQHRVTSALAAYAH